MLKVADLRARHLHFITTPMKETRARSAIEACKALDFALESWSIAAFEDKPTSAVRSTVTNPLRGNDVNGAHKLRSDHHAATYAQYLCLRLTVHNIIASYIETFTKAKISSMDDADKTQCHKSIARLSMDLCHTLDDHPSADQKNLREELEREWQQMEPKTAWLFVWPLTMAASIEFIPQPQKDWLQTKLDLVTSILGNTTFGSIR